MKLVRCIVIAAITFFGAMTILSAALFSKCRCSGKHFSPYICLISDWTPGVREDLPPCRENLIMLEAVKYEWAREQGAGEADKVTWDDLRIYLDQGKPPICNRGGHYVLGLIGEEPDCVGACCLHADPLEHSLEPAILYASDEGNPLASGRAIFRDRTRPREEAEASRSSEESEIPPEVPQPGSTRSGAAEKAQ